MELPTNSSTLSHNVFVLLVLLKFRMIYSCLGVIAMAATRASIGIDNAKYYNVGQTSIILSAHQLALYILQGTN